MDEDAVSAIVVANAVMLHQRLGPGLLESVYEDLLAQALVRAGLVVERQKRIDFEFDGLKFERGFCVDLLINGIVIIELKSVEHLAPVHMKQLLTYLRLMDLRLGLVLNFGGATMKEGIRRVANNHHPSRPSVPPRVLA